MKTNVIAYAYKNQWVTNREVIESLSKNGTYLPSVNRVVFNLKTTEEVPVRDEHGNVKRVPALNRDGSEIVLKDGTTATKIVYETKKLEYPILVTKVWWSDNTTTTVRNSKHDRITTEIKTLDDGSKVEVATEESKTIGIMAAVTKRTCGEPDENGELTNTNMGKILTDIVRSGYDQQLEAAKTKLERAKAKDRCKKAAEARKANNDKNTKRYSYVDCIQMLGPILEALSKNPVIANRLAEAVSASVDEQK